MAGADGDGVGSVADLLAKTAVKQINEVSFADKGLKLNKAEDAKDIVQAIEDCKDMQSLRLEGNTVGSEAAEAIAKALAKRPEFERAKWADMFTGRLRSEIPPALRHLGAAIMTAGAHLVEIDLSDNAFGPDGVKAVQELIESKACYTIKELRFNNNGLGIGGKLLAESLIRCHKSSLATGRPLALTVFVAGRNRLENPGAIALGEAFKTIGTLEEVAMPQNGINHDGITALAESFTHNKSLRSINLQDNTFTEKGAISMAKALKDLEKLESVNFGDCLVRTGGAAALADTFHHSLPNLRELNLSYGEIHRESGIKLAESMEKKDALRVLELNGNSFGEEGVELVRAVLEANGHLDALGSLSDDEGDDSDDDYEDVDDDEDTEDAEEEQEEGDDGEESQDPELQVQGVKAVISPRPEDNKENVVPATAAEFLCFPSANKLLGIGEDRGNLILKELGNDTGDLEKVVQVFVKVASVMDSKREAVMQAVYEATDVILRHLFNGDKCNPEAVANSILVHLGLIKSEDKIKPMRDPSGLLLAMAHVVKQDYFPSHLAQFFLIFLTKGHPVIDLCIQPKHQFLQALFTI
ncbi:ran GTPase-activating protein 1-like [Patiria miniata]|uniref:Ran-GTPase activating protein 1 C-terminal domain-containing protein n=1 Tax=Patiria miniata TaxID=46514 RepID=A0A913ZX67_PATMI|nr:ran GTPase-activating protein 1-like [Patiria miniata]